MKMRKFLIVCISVLCAAPTIVGQEGTKDHSELFPKAGDYSLGLDMGNVIKFIGNSFSSAGTANFPANSIVEPSITAVAVSPTIYGRYFLTDNMATRVRLGVGVNNTTSRAFVYDDVANIDNPLNDDVLTYEKTVDELKSRNNQYELGIGLELRKNLWRMQGYAGAEVLGAYIHERSFSTYGNAISSTNHTPTTYDFVNATTATPTHRDLDTKGGNTFHFGGGLYAGADFFITRNISIGAEFNLFIFGTRSTEKIGTVETYKLDQVYVGENKITPITGGFATRSLGTFNISVYF